MRKWLAFLFAGLLGAAAYVKLTQRDPDDDGWGDLGPDWWDL